MELTDELVEEIFLRLSPEEPSHLVRAALVCRSWCRTISDGGFRRRYRAFHRNNPPLLGYFHNLSSSWSRWSGDSLDVPRFVHTSTTAASSLRLRFTHPADDCSGRRNRQGKVLDSRHGRVLIHTSLSGSDSLVVWDPMTGDQQHMNVPDRRSHFTGAVVCANAVHGCDHLDCHGGPFTVVFLAQHGYSTVTASMYSSETKQWRKSNSVQVEGFAIDRKPSLLAGTVLYFPIDKFGSILKYDVGGHRLSEIDTANVLQDLIITGANDGGGLRVVADMDDRICVWTQQQDGVNGGTGSGSGWVRRTDIRLHKLLPRKRQRSYFDGDDDSDDRREVVGYAEGTDTVFINRDREVYTLDLKSRKVRMTRNVVGFSRKRDHHHAIYPYIGFYTPDIAKGRLPPP